MTKEQYKSAKEISKETRLYEIDIGILKSDLLKLKDMKGTFVHGLGYHFFNEAINDLYEKEIYRNLQLILKLDQELENL